MTLGCLLLLSIQAHNIRSILVRRKGFTKLEGQGLFEEAKAEYDEAIRLDSQLD